jgi:outer membrane protein OmpA-like peptidoglycan-associated protein
VRGAQFFVWGALFAAGCASTKVVTIEGEEIASEDLMDIDVVVEKCAVPDLITYFDFDSDDIGRSDNLDSLARCITSGPLAGSEILLVGHTDRIGGARYNEKLGLSRAQKVAAYLIDRGVSERRIKYQSLGKTRASGNPQEYARDRRVEIFVRLD